LWFIGKAIGLPGFQDANDEELDEMNKAIARAKREDRKGLRAMDEVTLNQQMGNYIGGTGDQEGLERGTQYTSAFWMTKIRAKYEGAVIRRTVKSVDNTGQAISGLEPYEEHRCVIELYEHEYAALENLAEEAMDSETFVRRFASEVSR
jgi:hypothetical protein